MCVRCWKTSLAGAIQNRICYVPHIVHVIKMSKYSSFEYQMLAVEILIDKTQK